MMSTGPRHDDAESADEERAQDDVGRAWVVRAGSRGEAESSNLELGRASIGWFEVPDMTPLTTQEQVRDIVDELYPDTSAQSRGATTGQLWAFRASIAVGDLVVLPLMTHPGMIAVGRCIGGYGFDPAAPEAARHFLPVRWQPEFVPRAALRQDLLAMVNGARRYSVSPGTVRLNAWGLWRRRVSIPDLLSSESPRSRFAAGCCIGRH